MNQSPFVNYPQFGFGNGAPRSIMGNLSADEAAAVNGLDIKQAIDDILYDTKYWQAGAAVPVSDVLFYSQQINATDTVVNNGAISFVKNPSQTNMVQSAQLQRGEIFLAESMQVMVCIPGTLDFSLQATGNTTLPNATGTSATADATHASVNLGALHNAICKAGVVQLKVGTSGPLEGGPIYQFPSEFGASGFNGLAQTGAAKTGDVVLNDGVINNGYGFARTFRTGWRRIEAGNNLQVKLNFYNPFTPGRNFDVQVILKGLRFRDIS